MILVKTPEMAPLMKKELQKKFPSFDDKAKVTMEDEVS